LYFHTDFTVSAMHDEKILKLAAKTMRKAARETIAEVK
jgi:hypothetical protein